MFGSNLTYLSEELKNRPWFYEVDVSKYIAYFISALNHDMSISALIDSHKKIDTLLEKRKEERSKYRYAAELLMKNSLTNARLGAYMW